MEEKKFPIYEFNLKWNQNNYRGNSSSINIMFKEIPTEDELQRSLNEFKTNTEKRHLQKGEVILEWLICEYKYVEDESWVLHWFNHMTYNQFGTDEEIEKSFDKFIDRKKLLNIQNGHRETEMRYRDDNMEKPFYCFMGAEDSWRWKICRCKHCIAQGKITIDH